MTINDRVENLRRWMKDRGLQAFVIPTMDPHNSEYVAEHWQCRRWISGFTGSAGTAVVTMDDARLWTDSRYWLQAQEQLMGTPFVLMRDLQDITVNQWLRQNVRGQVGYCPDMMVPDLFQEFLEGVDAVAVQQDPFDELWADRPSLPLSMAEIMPDEIAGESAASKLQRMKDFLDENGIGRILISELSEVMWMLNLRGNDIPYNPFIISFLLLRSNGEHTFYVHEQQIDTRVREYLQSLNISIARYEDAPRSLEGPTPVSAWRAIKNQTEQEGFRKAHLRDGIAMVKFLRRLDEWSADQNAPELTELGVDRVLTELRAQQEGFRGLSFETISSYGPHGAVVHYEPTPETDIPLQRHSFLLLDSGGHYDCGSTDITRTIALGSMTPQERKVYTLVLRGHLQLQNMQFPVGTTGLQLDTAARMSMWREGFDFGHGTGHGVGHRLGVHEGPCQIRKNCRQDTTIGFRAGQNVTDEPGIYIPGQFGVRIENTLLCVPAGENDFGHFLKFEPLTLCPYDLRPVEVEMLTMEEREWLNAYHQKVRETLLPYLEDEADRQWLQHSTRAV